MAYKRKKKDECIVTGNEKRVTNDDCLESSTQHLVHNCSLCIKNIKSQEFFTVLGRGHPGNFFKDSIEG
jgi:hypothetical protein